MYFRLFFWNGLFHHPFSDLRRHGGGRAPDEAPGGVGHAEHLGHAQINDHGVGLLPFVLGEARGLSQKLEKLKKLELEKLMLY